jgi:hypothetical protein
LQLLEKLQGDGPKAARQLSRQSFLPGRFFTNGAP